jgi:excisionase family DNA binding protein
MPSAPTVAPNGRVRRHPNTQADNLIPSLRRWVSIQDAAEYLGVTDRTIRAMIADGRLTGYRSGTRLVRLDLNEINAAMRPFGGAL